MQDVRFRVYDCGDYQIFLPLAGAFMAAMSLFAIYIFDKFGEVMPPQRGYGSMVFPWLFGLGGPEA